MASLLFALLFALLAIAICAFLLKKKNSESVPPVPISVNYHLTRKCNYECGFCFHTAKTSYILPLEEAKQGLTLLKQAGMKKLNFAGGEPMLYPNFVGKLAAYCKTELGLESVSIVTNGSLVRSHFLETFGQFIDIIAVSCDSFNEVTNVKIGRGRGSHLEKFKQLRMLCQTHEIKFKVNTVVNRYNFEEDMRAAIDEISPFRWKCFQVLVVKGENDSDSTLRDATKFVISDKEFQQFCQRHSTCSGFVPEPNNLMKDSYLILDEYMRFLDKGNDPSYSILEVGVEKALRSVFWDETSFIGRGGIYDWTKETSESTIRSIFPYFNLTMTVYEIEQKFVFNPALLACFRANRGQPPFRWLVHQRVESFEDEYFDSANLLSKSGIWIRRRNQIWEAKQRQGGDFLRSSFYETDKIDEIKRLISVNTQVGACPGPDDNFGLASICRYRTKRETFLADRRFSIMLDSTDFGHWVGEVELQTQQTASALSDIDSFMRRYAWFFASKDTPKGKMTAYFEHFGFPHEAAT